MAEQEKKKSDPDNVFVKDKTDDPATSIVFVPADYREAHAALKAAGAKFVGAGNWSLPKTALEGAEAGIREAARRDIGMGQDGRKEREDRIRLSKEERKAERAAETGAKRAQAVKDRDADRVMVPAQALRVGDPINHSGAEKPITRCGTEFEVRPEKVDEFNERFPGNGFKAGDRVAYAYFDEPRKEAEKPSEAAGDLTAEDTHEDGMGGPG